MDRIDALRPKPNGRLVCDTHNEARWLVLLRLNYLQNAHPFVKRFLIKTGVIQLPVVAIEICLVDVNRVEFGLNLAGACS